jgi:4-amino-4-deoxy-L-arabinose transferase-like glycosyltransferase
MHLLPSNRTQQFTEKWCVVLAAVLTIFALFVNLGLVPMFIHVDEPRRGLVSLEMLLNGNLLVPTLNGELYFNKPPLYNWFMILSFLLTGSMEEFAVRLPMVLSIIFFGLTVYYFTRSHIEKPLAVLAAFMTITSGRMLFYDAFIGLLDITYSWFTYLELMLIFHFYHHRKWNKLFALSYTVAAVAFLLKGLPTLLFQGFTLFIWFGSEKEWKRLFSRAHFMGILFFMVIVGGYYTTYLFQHWQSGDEIITRLWDESARRTIVRFGILETIKQVCIFPYDFISQFFPWTFLVLFLFARKNLENIIDNSFLRFNALAFLVNIPVYWSAPEVRPRYLFIFTALLFTILVALYSKEFEKKSTSYKIVTFLLLLLSGIAVIMPIAAVIHPETRSIDYAWLKALILIAPLVFFFILSLKNRERLLLNMVITLLIVKMGYNWFVLPSWYPDKYNYKQIAENIVAKIGDSPLSYLNTDVNFDGISYYMTAARRKIITRKKGEPQTDRFYIGDDVEYPRVRREVLLRFDTKYKQNQVLVRFWKE